jgi:hypothetical protein
MVWEALVVRCDLLLENSPEVNWNHEAVLVDLARSLSFWSRRIQRGEYWFEDR